MVHKMLVWLTLSIAIHRVNSRITYDYYDEYYNEDSVIDFTAELYDFDYYWSYIDLWDSARVITVNNEYGHHKHHYLMKCIEDDFGSLCACRQ